MTYGLAAFVVANVRRGLILFYFIPAKAVTPTYVALTANSTVEVFAIAFVAATEVERPITSQPTQATDLNQPVP